MIEKGALVKENGGFMKLKPRNEKQNPAAAMAVTIAFMYLLSGIFLALLALLLYQFDLSEAVVKIGIVAIYIASGFFGGFFIGKRIQDKKYLWGLFAGSVYFLCLFIVSVLMKQGMGEILFFEPLKILTTLLLCAVSGMAGGMLS